MCGIAGIYYFDSRKPSRHLLEQMTEMMHHRGPDDTGYFIDDGIGLGFKRLSIIDLHGGHQPIGNEDESVQVVLNGEIYNYKYLRSLLESKGHRFKTESDTEVLVHLYEEYGSQCITQLRGMFAFAVWDRKRREVFAARDFFGIKPFYYYVDQEQFLFASEVKAIHAVGVVKRTIRPESVLNYLTFQYVPDPHTMFEHVQTLPPAHYLHIRQNGSITLKKYWEPTFEPKDRPIEDYIDELRYRLEDSVKYHMHSDVKSGCLLSSGIDSTSIAAHMRHIRPIQTFSVGFEGPQNECQIARQTAEKLGTEHYDHIIGPDEYFDVLPKAVWHQDEPVADPSAIALYFVARLAREHVTVALSGEGADELLGGYRIYREPISLRAFDYVPMDIKRVLHRVFKKLPASVKGRNTLLRATTPLRERFFGNAMLFSEDIKRDLTLYDSELISSYRNPIDIAGPFYDRVKHLDPSTQMQYIDLNLWMPGDILAKADKMTMAHSLELRVPFLDKEVFEIARSIPVRYRLAENTTKFIFRKAMEGIVPDTILHRPKLGFPVPLRDWLRTQYADRVLEQVDTNVNDLYLNRTAFHDMVRRHRNGQGDYARKIWAIYIFSLWHKTYVEDQNKERQIHAI